MSITQSILLLAILLSSIMVFLTYSPADYGYFWTYWVSSIFILLYYYNKCTSNNIVLQATLLTFAVFGYLIDVLFSAQLTFVYDPNIENWARKTNPQT